MQDFPDALQETLEHIAKHGLATPIRVAMIAMNGSVMIGEFEEHPRGGWRFIRLAERWIDEAMDSTIHFFAVGSDGETLHVTLEAEDEPEG